MLQRCVGLWCCILHPKPIPRHAPSSVRDACGSHMSTWAICLHGPYPTWATTNPNPNPKLNLPSLHQPQSHLTLRSPTLQAAASCIGARIKRQRIFRWMNERKRAMAALQPILRGILTRCPPLGARRGTIDNTWQAMGGIWGTHVVAQRELQEGKSCGWGRLWREPCGLAGMMGRGAACGSALAHSSYGFQAAV